MQTFPLMQNAPTPIVLGGALKGAVEKNWNVKHKGEQYDLGLSYKHDITMACLDKKARSGPFTRGPAQLKADNSAHYV